MSDATDKNAQSDSADQTETSGSEVKTDFMTNKDFNVALNQRMKAFEAKVLAAIKPPEPTKTDKESGSSNVNKALEEKLAAIEARHQKARENAKSNSLKAEFSAKGVKPELLDMVAEYYGKNVHYADDDSDDLIFRDTNGDVSVKTAIEAIIKSEKGKHYLSPGKTPNGSGDKSKSSNSGNQSSGVSFEDQKKLFGL